MKFSIESPMKRAWHWRKEQAKKMKIEVKKVSWSDALKQGWFEYKNELVASRAEKIKGTKFSYRLPLHVFRDIGLTEEAAKAAQNASWYETDTGQFWLNAPIGKAPTMSQFRKLKKIMWRRGK